MIGKSFNRKKAVDTEEEYFSKSTGESLASAVGTITSFNTSDNDFVIIDSKEYIIVDKNAIEYLSQVFSSADMGYIHKLISMCKGEYNALHDNNGQALTRAELQKQLAIAKNTFVTLMVRLHKGGVIGYLEVYVKNKKMKYVILNPTLARRCKKIRKDTAKLFFDLSEEYKRSEFNRS